MEDGERVIFTEIINTNSFGVSIISTRRISRTQELQMTKHANDSNVTLIQVDGTSDDLDVPCMEIYNDFDFKTKHKVSRFSGSIYAIFKIHIVAN